MKKKIIICVTCILIAVVSATGLADKMSSREFHQESIQYLDNKKDTVLALTAAAAVTSTAIAAVPGDATTPIANTISDASEKLIIVTCALYLEKYLVTALGTVSFRFLIPIASVLVILYILFGKKTFCDFAIRISLFAIAAFMVIPCSVSISKSIDSAFSDTIQETIDYSENETIEEDTNSKNWWNTITDTITETTSNTIEYCKSAMGKFIDSIAVMIVTTCLIPVGVMFLFIYLIKILMGIDLSSLFTEIPGRKKEITL